MLTVWIACGAFVLGQLLGYWAGLRRGKRLAEAQATAYGALGAMAYTEAQKRLAKGDTVPAPPPPDERRD